MRHGMAEHNRMQGLGSISNRDAELTDLGQRQAQTVGDIFRVNKVVNSVELAIVSPFTRTLQTFLAVQGDDGLLECPTVVQALCAEHTLGKSKWAQGDRGSTADELGSQRRFEQFDFKPLDRYSEH